LLSYHIQVKDSQQLTTGDLIDTVNYTIMKNAPVVHKFYYTFSFHTTPI
jgi:hypothetical protein